MFVLSTQIGVLNLIKTTLNLTNFTFFMRNQKTNFILLFSTQEYM